jgi:hypothetical protein
MFIEINDKTTIGEISEKFSEYFPHLQIEFYIKLHQKSDVPVKEDQTSAGEFAGRVRQSYASDLMEIQPYYKIIEIEKAFRQRFGLSARVFRRETDVRKQIKGTNDLTIKELNEMG